MTDLAELVPRVVDPALLIKHVRKGVGLLGPLLSNEILDYERGRLSGWLNAALHLLPVTPHVSHLNPTNSI